MKIIKAGKVLSLVAAGKIACSTQIAFGKGVDEDIADSELSLSETSYVDGIINEPTDGSNGTICASVANDTRVDFLISGIRSDIQMDVYLAMSTSLDTSWPQSRGGQFQLASNALEIIAAITLEPTDNVIQKPQLTSIGEATLGNHLPFPISFYWSDMNDSRLSNNEFHLQAIAFPSGGFDFGQAQVSELDTFTINRSSDCSGDAGKGDDGDDNSGKGSDDDGGGDDVNVGK